MKRMRNLAAIILILMLVCLRNLQPALAQNPTQTLTSESRVENVSPITETPTPLPGVSLTSTGTLTAAAVQVTETSTPTLTSSLTSAPTATPQATPIPTDTPTATLTPSTVTPTTRPTEPGPTATNTASATSTATGQATLTPSSTPTVTPLWPTDTPTPTATWTLAPTCTDELEPNGQAGSGPILIIDEIISNLTLYPQGDIDFFLLWAKGGRFYELTTITGQGVDTRLRVFDPTGALIAENDDYLTGSPASRVKFQAPGEGWFAVAVDSRVPTDWGCRQYSLRAIDVSSPPPTPTRTPGPPSTATPPATAIPAEAMYDEYEPNYDFGTAANLGVGQTLSLNFNTFPAGSNAVDNDFFRMYVKVGEVLQIETTNLAEGLDTNLIIYREDGQIVAGNDDCAPGERRSCLTWSPDYSGLAYVLVGPVGTIPEAISAGARSYNLVVHDAAGKTPTPAPGGSSGGYGGSDAGSTAMGSATPAYGLPWPVTPLPPTPTATLTPTRTATPVVHVRSLASAPTAATPTPRPLQPLLIQLTIYYDENNNRAPDVNEGVAGISVRALDGISNQLLGHVFTDRYGHATLSIVANAEVRVSIPYLGYNETVRTPGKTLTIRLMPLRLPSLIP